MLLCVCSVIDHRRRQHVVRTSVTYWAIASCISFLLPYFDVICDLLLNRRTATWNLFNVARLARQWIREQTSRSGPVFCSLAVSAASNRENLQFHSRFNGLSAVYMSKDGCRLCTQHWWYVSLRKSNIRFLNPKESENGFCVSLQNRSIKISRIMVRQRNRKSTFKSGFFGFFDAQRSERSWIDLFG